ncbi:MAG TPA: hypothetical protein VF832_18970, partial [Longimicrobiales bacterium]
MNAPARVQGEAIPSGYRDVRLAGAPLVSLVVLADRDLPLEALAAECGERGVELIAVQRREGPDAAETAELEAACPGVRFVRVSAALSPAALRERGLAAAEGDIVLFADAGAAQPGWLDQRLGRWSTRTAYPLRGGAEPAALLTTSTRSAE